MINYTPPLPNKVFFNTTHECLYLVLSIETPIRAPESDRRRHGFSTTCKRGVERRPPQLRLARFQVIFGDLRRYRDTFRPFIVRLTPAGRSGADRTSRALDGRVTWHWIGDPRANGPRCVLSSDFG